MAFWPFSNLFPGTNYDRVNLDWIMTSIKKAVDSVAASEQASRDSARAIQTAEEAKEIATQAATGVIGDGAVTWVKLAAAVQQMITDLQTGLASLTGRVSNNESAITSQASAISDLETTDTQMQSSLDTLSGTVTSQGGRITSNSSAINSQASQIGDLDGRVTALEQGGTGGAGTTELTAITSADRLDGSTDQIYTYYKKTRGMVEIFVDFNPINTGGNFTNLFQLPSGFAPSRGPMVWPVWLLHPNEGVAANRYLEITATGMLGYASQGSGSDNRFYWYITYPAAES
jgi:hypothetical protein